MPEPRCRARTALWVFGSVGSTGSPLAPEGFDWVREKLGEETWLFSTSGGTDVCTAFVGGVPTLPVYRGELQARALAAETPQDADKLALAFQRVSRGVRQTFALELKIGRERRAAALDEHAVGRGLVGAVDVQLQVARGVQVEFFDAGRARSHVKPLPSGRKAR